MRKGKKVLQWVVLWVFLLMVFGGEASGALILNPSISLAERFDDNFLFAPKGGEAVFTSLVLPSLDIKIESQYIVLSTIYSGSLQFYHDSIAPDQYYQTASFDLDIPFLSYQFKGVRIKIIEDVTYTPEISGYDFGETPTTSTAQGQASETFGDQILANNEGIQLQRADTFINRAGVNIDYTLSSRLGSTVSYYNVITRYDSPTLADSDGHIGNLTLRYQGTRRTDLTTAYRYTKTIFAGGDDLDVHEILFGAIHRKSETFFINSSLGTTILEKEKPQFTFRIGLVQRFKSGRFSFQYVNDTGSGAGLTTAPSIRHRFISETQWSLSDDISVYFRLAYGNHRSISGGNVKIQTYTANPGMNVKIFSWLTGNLSYSYFNQQNQGTIGREGDRNLVVFMLTATGQTLRYFN